MEKVYKVVRISEGNYNKIAEHGRFHETFDQALGNIIQKAELLVDQPGKGEKGEG